MRILYHHRTLCDGAEGIHINAMVDAFRGLGHEVRLATGAQPSGRTSVLAAAVKAMLPRVVVELASLAWNLSDYVSVRRQIRSFEPDLIYKRHGRYDVGAILAARHGNVPLVLEVNVLYCQKPYRDYEPHAFEGVARRMERWTLASASMICAVSTPLMKQVQEVSGRIATVVANGADAQIFDARHARADRVRARHGLTALTIGWSGIIREWHGVELLLDAVASLDDVQLLIVGDGPGRPAIEARAKTLGIQDHTVITGRVPHSEMPEYIAAMDIAVVAAERTGVASPMKLLEYMSMERAVIAPRLENIMDIVEDGVNGFLFSSDDVKALRAALQRLLQDSAMRQRLGQNARRLVETKRNWRAIAREVLDMALEHSQKDGPSPPGADTLALDRQVLRGGRDRARCGQ